MEKGKKRELGEKWKGEMRSRGEEEEGKLHYILCFVFFGLHSIEGKGEVVKYGKRGNGKEGKGGNG